MSALSSRSSLSSLTNHLLGSQAYQPLQGLEPEVEADPASDIGAAPLSPKVKAKQAYQAFCKSAKDFYVVCAGPNQIKPDHIVDIKRASDRIGVQYNLTIAKAKASEDLSDLEKAVIRQKEAYDKAAQTFAEFQTSASEDIRNEVIAAVHHKFQEMCEALSPTTQQQDRTLQIMTVKLNVTTERLEQQAGRVFSQLISFGNKILTEEEEKARIGSLQDIARIYNCFYSQTSEIKKLAKKRPSAIKRIVESVRQFANTPQETGVFL